MVDACAFALPTTRRVRVAIPPGVGKLGEMDLNTKHRLARAWEIRAPKQDVFDILSG